MQRMFSGQFLELFSAAAAAVARASDRVVLSPNPRVLSARLRLVELEALGWLEGEAIIPDQLALDYGDSPRAWRNWPFAFVGAFDRRLPSSAVPTAQAITQWLKPAPHQRHRVAAMPPRFAIDADRLGAWEKHQSSSPLPRLIAAADLAVSFARHTPLSAGNLVIGVILADRFGLPAEAGSAGGLAAIGMLRRQIAWTRLVAGAPEEELDDLSSAGGRARVREAWLEAVAEGGLALIALDHSVRRWQQALDEAVSAKRSSSRLRTLAELAAMGSSLTASRAARALTMSRQGTTQLLEEGCRLHLLREITHGSAFRRFVATI